MTVVYVLAAAAVTAGLLLACLAFYLGSQSHEGRPR